MCYLNSDYDDLLNVFGILPYAVSYKCFDKTIQWVNSAWETSFGLQLADIQNKHLSEVWINSSKEFAFQYERDEQLVLETNVMLQNVVHAYFLNDEMQYHLDTLIPTRNKNNEQTGIITISTDITKLLKQSKQLELILSNTSDMIIVFDRNYTYREIYPGLIMHAANTGDLIGKTVYEVFVNEPNVTEAFKDAMIDLHLHKKALLTYTLNGHEYEGMLSWFNASGLLCFIRDITGRKKLDPISVLSKRINEL